MDLDVESMSVRSEPGPEGRRRSPVARRRSRAASVIVGSWLAITLLFAASPVTTNGDAYLTFHTAHSLAYERNLDLSEFMDIASVRENSGLATVEGRPVTYFPWVTAAFMVPVLWGWDAVSDTGVVTNTHDLIASDTTDLIQRLSASAITGAAAVAIGLVTAAIFKASRPTRGRVGSAEPMAGWNPDRWWFLPAATLTVGLTTTMWSTASRAMWQHGPSLLMLGLALLAIVHLSDTHRPRMLATLAGAALGISYWARPPNATLVLALVGFVFWQHRGRTIDALVGFVATWAGLLVLNVVLVGVAFPPYYASSRVGLHGEFVDAAAANLASPARGVLFFSPFALMAAVLLLPSRHRILPESVWRLSLAVMCGATLYLLLVSGYGAQWWGGHSYGPRFLTEPIALVTPFALLATFGPRTRTSPNAWLSMLVAPLLIVFSGLVHGEGALTNASGCWNALPVNVDDDRGRVWDLRDPEFLLGFRLLIEHGPVGARSTACDPHRPPLI